ncbi:MAG: hypothetical protein ABSG62_14355 [Terracidiphilus sp.]|jgi:hypothetical protein
MRRPEIDFATLADDSAIRNLLRRESMPGKIRVRYEREPEFWVGCDATGEDCRVLVAREADHDEIVGLACRSTRRVFVNGSAQRLGYLGQLRVDSRFRGQWLVSRGFSKLRQLHDADPLPAYLVAIVDGNREATGVLVQHPRRAFPIFHAVANCRTVAILVNRPKPSLRSDATISVACKSDLEDVARFLNAQGPRRQFSPYWSEEHLTRLASYGLGVNNFRIVRRGGEIAGVGALWDQSGFKQTVLEGYSGWLKLVAPLYNKVAPWLGLTALPHPGEKLQSAYLSLFCVANDDLSLSRVLLRELYNLGQGRGLRYLFVGFDSTDPLMAATRNYIHVVYPSRLYLAEWADGEGIHEQLDRRPVNIDIATL